MEARNKMGLCSAPACEYVYSAKSSWKCRLTKKTCVANVLKGDTNYFGRQEAEKCPGYNLPEYLAVAVKKFRTDVGIPLSQHERLDRDRIAELENLVQQQEGGEYNAG
jgi:hypothetical protein